MDFYKKEQKKTKKTKSFFEKPYNIFSKLRNQRKNIIWTKIKRVDNDNLIHSPH